MTASETRDPRDFPVVVVDDEPDNLDAFRFTFRKTFTLHMAAGAREALALLAEVDAAVIVTDQRMPGMTGLELLAEAQHVRPEAVGIILTAFTDVDVLLDAVNRGQVYRYVTKPWDSRDLKNTLTQAIERHHLVRENRRLTEQLGQYAGYLDELSHGAFDFGNIMGRSPALRRVLAQVEQVAPTASTVLLRGETGTGKEMVARALHLNSDRANRPFVAVNCAALPGALLESELFGHEKGAFTGAIARRKGRFELADGGTLFLDEVGDLPLEMQVKLLRVLQEREIERVGGVHTLHVDVRLISATNANLEELVARGRFREDLYYRINVFPITLPPLRQRGDDVVLLAEHFLEKVVRQNRRGPLSLDDDARDRLRGYPWPGNVRELQNIIERAAIVTTGEVVRGVDLDLGQRGGGCPGGPERPNAGGAAGLRQRLEEEERSSIARAIEQSSGNIAAAARALGVNRSTLYFRIKKLNLDHMLPNRLMGQR